MGFLAKLRRLKGWQTLADGSSLCPLTRESLIYRKGERSVEISFLYDGAGNYNVILNDSGLWWAVKGEEGCIPLTPGERLSLARNIEEYCRQRDYSFTIFN